MSDLFITIMFITFGVCWLVATITFLYLLIMEEFSKPDPYSVWNLLKEKRKKNNPEQ